MLSFSSSVSFLNGIFGQQSWRNAFLGSEAHAFQHFGLAHYAAVTVRELVEGFVVIPLQAGQSVADTEEGVGKACNLSYKMVPRLMMACTFFTWFSFFQRSSERRRALIRLVGSSVPPFCCRHIPRGGYRFGWRGGSTFGGMNIMTKSGDWAS